MKQYLAAPLEEHLEDLSGTPSKKVEKLISIFHIYSKPFTETNYKKYLRPTENNRDFKMNFSTRVLELNEGFLFVFIPKTIGEFISLMRCLGYTFYWEESVWRDYLYINRKY